ncbi:hypothetical protein ETD85_47895 [Nonomuraea zeae]|uniref:DUF1440 domain-containing protein n=1 Tax=Nonomuraea zeae TaxID=1642303 RepID=A0A5S4GBW2_9ACTN|nr:hypothetical protein ETD85_47895 [Nonomuraea zeae]
MHERPAARPRRSLPRACARGAIGAMAMSGLRQFTTAVGLVKKVPPEAVLERAAPRMTRRMPSKRLPAMVELAHWGYGAVGGLVFGLLPSAVRGRSWAGPVYGIAIWAAFETTIAPALGLPRRSPSGAERLALLADHLLYGTVVGSAPWPHQDEPARAGD